MELNEYVGKVVKIDLKNGFYYKGKVISCDDNSILLTDKHGNKINIAEEQITLIKEMEE